MEENKVSKKTVNSTPEPTKNEDVDLIELFQAIYKGLSSFLGQVITSGLRVILSTRKLLFKNIWLWSLTSLLGGVIGFLLVHTAKPYFSTHAIVQSSYLRGYQFQSEIYKLNDLCKEDSYQILGKKLNLSGEEASVLKSMNVQSKNTFYKVYDYHQQESAFIYDSLSTLSEANSTQFVVTMTLVSTDGDLPKIQEGLKNYFDNHSFIAKRFEAEQDSILQQKKVLQKELEQLNELKQVYNQSLLKENNLQSTSLLMSGQDADKNPVLEVYKESQNLNNQLLKMEKTLKVMSKFEYINGFTEYTKHGRVGRVQSTATGLAYGFLFGFGIILLFTFNKYLTQAEKNLTAID